MNRWIVGVLAAVTFVTSLPAHAACNFDIDGDGQMGATTDGLLVVRYMLGIRGAALISGAVGTAASRTSAAEIEAVIATPCAQAGWVDGGSGRLNDSGVTFGGSYPSGNSGGCTGNQIAQQDCTKGRDANVALNGAADGKAGFSFAKISNTGAVVPASTQFGSGANDWACTYDRVTGLMWEVKTATPGVRYMYHTYTWYSTDASNNVGLEGVANGGSCAISGTCDTEGFASSVNAVGLCGHTDWRVPHVKELESLIDFGSTFPPFDSTFFPNTVGSNYWSITPYTANTNYAWAVSFDLATSSYGSYNSARGNLQFIRLVRSGL